MVLIRILDIIWDMFSWHNIRDFAQRARLMWPITRRFVQRKRLQVVLMSLAVALGFSAYLVFQAIFGQNTSQVLARVEQPHFPSSLIICHREKITRGQLKQIDDIFYAHIQAPAIDISPLIRGQEQPILGFAADNDFWRSQIRLLDGTADISADQILLPKQLAENWQLAVGDPIQLTHTGTTQPVYQVDMTVGGIFESDALLFDRPLVLNTATICRGKSLTEPNVLFVAYHRSDAGRALNAIRGILRPEREDQGPRQYSWLRPNENTGDWVFKSIEPYTLLWSAGNNDFVQDAARNLVANNYSSGKGIIVMVFMFSALCIFNILLISLLTRRRDVGILKTIGYDDFSIFTSFLLEAGIVVGGGIIAGAVVTPIVFSWLGKYFGFALGITWGHIIKTGLLSFCIYMFTAAVPADMARYTSVMELLQERPLRSSWEEDPLYRRPTTRRPLRTARSR